LLKRWIVERTFWLAESSSLEQELYQASEAMIQDIGLSGLMLQRLGEQQEKA